MIRLTGLISTQRSYADLILIVKSELPKYLQFEGVALLLKDVRTNQLFSIEQDFTQLDMEFYEYVKQRTINGIPLTLEEKVKNFER